MAAASPTRTVAERLASMAAGAVGGTLPIRLRAWDGSETGPALGPVLVVYRRRAVRRLLWSPGEQGLAESYIAGDVDIEGDLAEALSAWWSAAAAIRARTGPAQWARLLTSAARLGALGSRPPAPGSAGSSRRQSGQRDPDAIAHHYDVSNEFYELLLDSSMAFSCGHFVDGPRGGLADAQQAKLELVCRKLGLRPGSRHLDVGCGWGSLLCYAAEHHGTHSTGVTSSRQQYEYVSKRVADAGLADRVQVRLADYRDLESGAEDGRFDAVSAIEVGEYVGDADYQAFAETLHRVLRPGGRALVQQVSRSEDAPGGSSAVAGNYIAPGLHLRPLDNTVSMLGSAGLEVHDVQALREHYAWTAAAWAEALERSWNGAVDVIGEVRARAWRLSLVGGALAFAGNRMGVEQILAVRPDAPGDAPAES